MNLRARRLVTRALACSLLMGCLVAAASAGELDHLTPEGQKLRESLDAMHVGQLWLPGGRVDWKTGEPLDDGSSNGKRHTHCSAFVAAACARLNVYILRPPEHSTVMLANAQYDWLREEGRNEGWRPVGDPVEAQELANRGVLVVATYKESRHRPGHIAIVRPCIMSLDSIEKRGPQIIQAGATNYRSTSLARGFCHHPAAWDGQRVRFFSHQIAAAGPVAGGKNLDRSSAR